jgi:hypothetical protein
MYTTTTSHEYDEPEHDEHENQPPLRWSHRYGADDVRGCSECGDDIPSPSFIAAQLEWYGRHPAQLDTVELREFALAMQGICFECGCRLGVIAR